MPSGPCMKASWTALLTSTAPIGTQPLVSPLASVIRSGVTPNSWAANGAPVRPKPVITSSKINRIPWRVRRAGEPGDGLEDPRANVGRIIQPPQPLELVGQLRPVRRRAAREGV